MGCCLLLKWCVRLGIALNLHGNGRPQVTGKNKPRPLYKKNERKVIIGCLDDLRYVVFGWSGLLKSQFLGGFRTFGKLLFCPVLFIYPILVFLFSCFLLSLSLSLSLLGVSDSVCAFDSWSDPCEFLCCWEDCSMNSLCQNLGGNVESEQFSLI